MDLKAETIKQLESKTLWKMLKVQNVNLKIYEMALKELKNRGET